MLGFACHEKRNDEKHDRTGESSENTHFDSPETVARVTGMAAAERKR